MSHTSTRLSFNAAFLREIKEDNFRVRELFHECSAAVTCPRGDADRLMVRLLWQLRDQLAMHFALENAFGYLTDVVDYAPRLCDRALAMIRQHDDLFLSLCELIEVAEELAYDKSLASRRADVANGFLSFRRRFEEHEREENRLLFDVFSDEVGGGD